MNQVSKTKAGRDLKGAILAAVGQIGGFDKFIKSGDIVLLKPNFNTADPFPAATDPEFLKAIVELVYQAGAKEVLVGDSSTMALDTRQVMKKLRIFDLENLTPSPKIIVFEEGRWVKKEVVRGQYLKNVRVPEILENVDKLILLPCLKTHFLAKFTGSLKLAVGFMKPFQRTRLHFRNLQEKIAELNTVINPDLIVMDGRKCFINRGPAEGDLKEPGLILASTSRVAIDIEGIKIIQSFEGNSLANINPPELPQIKRAMELNIN